MSISNFNPIIWSKGFLVNLNKVHVHAALCNRDYEGEIKQAGDTVKISSIGRVTIRAYTRNAGLGGTDLLPTITAIARPEVLVGSSLFLTISQADYFNFAIDDVDKYQQQPKLMDKAMKEASYGMANTVDQYVNNVVQTGVSGTTDGTGNRLTARTIGVGAGDDSPYSLLVDLSVKLREADVTGDMWVVVSPWFHGMIQKEVWFKSDSPEAVLGNNGVVGKAAGFKVLVSNNLSGATAGTLAVASGVYTILAGVQDACTYAEQVDEIDAYEPHDGFTDAVKGLHLYGAKVLRPYALASCAVTQAV